MEDDRPAPLIEVKPDPETLATAVAGELLNRIADAQAAGHVPHVGLTGGSIADAVHREVARMAPALRRRLGCGALLVRRRAVRRCRLPRPQRLPCARSVPRRGRRDTRPRDSRSRPGAGRRDRRGVVLRRRAGRGRRCLRHPHVRRRPGRSHRLALPRPSRPRRHRCHRDRGPRLPQAAARPGDAHVRGASTVHTPCGSSSPGRPRPARSPVPSPTTEPWPRPRPAASAARPRRRGSSTTTPPRSSDSPRSRTVRARSRTVRARSARAQRSTVRRQPIAKPAISAPKSATSCANSATSWSENDLAGLPAGAEELDRLVEDDLGLLVGATLLHVGEVGLVGLDLRRRRGVLGVESGRQAALRAVPGVGHDSLDGESDHRTVPMCAEVGHRLAWRSLATLCLTHRTCADTTTADRVATTSQRTLSSVRSGGTGSVVQSRGITDRQAGGRVR